MKTTTFSRRSALLLAAAAASSGSWTSIVRAQPSRAQSLNARTEAATTPAAELLAEGRTFIATKGRKSNAALKPASQFVADFSDDITTVGRTLGFAADGATISDYDLRDYVVWDRGNDNTWTENVFGRTGTVDVAVGANFHLRISGAGTRIVRNDFVGFNGRTPRHEYDNGLSESAAIKQDASDQLIEEISHNLVKHVPQDGIKTSNVKLVRENVVYAMSNVNAQPTPWSAATVYSIGDEVLHDNGRWFAIALRNGTLPHPPTGSVTAGNDDWQNLDPHADAFNPFQNRYDGAFYYRNVVYRDPQHPDIPVADRSAHMKFVNSYRVARNADEPAIRFEQLLMVENMSIGVSPTGTNGPIAIGKDGQVTNFAPVVLRGNILDDEGNSFVRAVENAFTWSAGNVDAATLDPIVAPSGSTGTDPGTVPDGVTPDPEPDPPVDPDPPDPQLPTDVINAAATATEPARRVSLQSDP